MPHDGWVAVGGVFTALISGVISFTVARVTSAPQVRTVESEIEEKLWARVNRVLETQDRELDQAKADVIRLRAIIADQSEAIARLRIDLTTRDETIAHQAQQIGDLEREVACLRSEQEQRA